MAKIYKVKLKWDKDKVINASKNNSYQMNNTRWKKLSKRIGTWLILQVMIRDNLGYKLYYGLNLTVTLLI